MLFKHFKTLQSYGQGFEQLVNKAVEYRAQEHNEARWTLSARELQSIQEQMDSMTQKSVAFTTHFLDIRGTVAEAFMAQIAEYTTVVDNKVNVGIDDRITV